MFLALAGPHRRSSQSKEASLLVRCTRCTSATPVLQHVGVVPLQCTSLHDEWRRIISGASSRTLHSPENRLEMKQPVRFCSINVSTVFSFQKHPDQRCSLDSGFHSSHFVVVAPLSAISTAMHLLLSHWTVFTSTA